MEASPGSTITNDTDSQDIDTNRSCYLRTEVVLCDIFKEEQLAHATQMIYT